ncbi:hypothetical protein, partial [Vibrio kanaloae]|uniref:hypothetical protein n=1 Tax=Vibrio kanaloae TaxID=170673 RepID=UPI0019D16EAF
GIPKNVEPNTGTTDWSHDPPPKLTEVNQRNGTVKLEVRALMARYSKVDKKQPKTLQICAHCDNYLKKTTKRIFINEKSVYLYKYKKTE